MLCVGDGRADRLEVAALFCRGDSFEEDLCWEPKLGVFVDLVDLDDAVDVVDVGVTLLKTVEALRGAFFFSAGVELKTKGAGGRGAGLGMIDSNLRC